jgi:hypothetical protein
MARMTGRVRRIVVAAALLAATARAQQSDPQSDPAPATAEEFQKKLASQGIELDLAKREVRLRADVLRRRRGGERPVEFALVVPGGATHETFGIAQCTPSLLNACFLALGLEPGKPRRRVAKEPAPPREDVELGLELPFDVLPPTGPRVFLYVRWKEADGKEVVRAFEDFLIDPRKSKPLPVRGFVYIGSRFEVLDVGREKKRVFLADYTLNLVPLRPRRYAAEDCLFDVYATDDEPYEWADVDEPTLPPAGVPVEFLFTLATLPGTRPFEPEVPTPKVELPTLRELVARSKNPCVDGSNDAWVDRLGKRDLAQLCSILERGRTPLRELCAEALGAAKRDEAVEPLSVSLRLDRVPDVRLASAYALVEIGSDAALNALVDVLAQNGIAARDEALAALQYVSGEDLGRQPDPWRAWVKARAR